MKYLTILLLFFSLNGFGQNKITKDTSYLIKCYDIDEDDKVKVNPEFKGGFDSMYKFIDSIMIYPKIGIEKKIEGSIWVQFTVLKTGKLTKIKIARSFQSENNINDTTITNSFENEVKRIISLMPNWIPGKDYENNPIDVNKVILFFKFELNKVH